VVSKIARIGTDHRPLTTDHCFFMSLSPTEIYKGRKIFLLGGTGFLGKVSLSMLLHRFPNVGKVYLMVRAPSTNESEARFWNNIITSPVFDPLRERYGGAFEGFIAEKIEVVNGDIAETNLGLNESEAERIAKDIDILINSSGNVTFNPPLESARRSNIVGTRNVIAFAKRMNRPCLIHTSTCFTAGNRSGPVWEEDSVSGYFPRRDELEGIRFSVEEEIEDCAKLSARVREESKDVMMNARFRNTARERLYEEGRDPDDERELTTAIARERKVWIRERLTELGMDRAKWWGWPNIYTYTKSIGEQLVAQEKDIVRTIIRPAIVESSVEFPFPGWNEGFTTTAPLIFLALKGQVAIPASNKLILDLIPVDHVAAGMLAVAAQAMVEQPKMVFQFATGDVNPNRMERIVSLLGLYKRKHFQEKESGFKFINEIAGRMETKTVSYDDFSKTATPMINSAAKKASSLLDKIRPRWGGGRLVDMVDRAKQKVDRVKEVTSEITDSIDLFKPFIIENEYVFRTDNIRALMDRIRPEERGLLPWDGPTLDWYNYWMNVHFPGLKKWVFPSLEEDMAEKPKRVYTYRDLLELFEVATKRHATRVAMRYERDGSKEQYTYADLRELANRAAAFLVGQEVRPGERIILCSENRPEWGMSYFGVLKAGCTCIPVDSQSSLNELVTFARAGAATGIIVSQDIFDKYLTLQFRLEAEGLPTKVWRFDEIFELGNEELENERIAKLPQRISGSTMASLIFTSGTTGNPKGVMLSHRNMTSMVSMLSSVFDFSTRDSALSVLPLHHTFEFSAGFLTPISRGVQITYLSELNGDTLSSALKNGNVTAMVGVPALWELLHRRIKTNIVETSPRLWDVVETLAKANAWLRDKTPLNLGPFIFYPIHQKLGGHIRYVISGGSALNQSVLKSFHGMGFTMLEGYGLTEASPVLAVTRPNQTVIPGSVGQALPGVEIMIADPDERGVGEIIARGPNVMSGYYENELATRNVLRDRWLYTGDLGKLDEDGNLYIVGRSKEIIVDSNGKNVYPDELEEVYGANEFVKELSIVGLPDGLGERVSCLVVPDYKRDESLGREEVRERVEQHFRTVSASLPLYKRVKVLQFWEADLPRTATRKVKRREVVNELQRLQKLVKTASKTPQDTAEEKNAAWLIDIVSAVSGKPKADITIHTKLGELGFDSLMYVELVSAIENAGGVIPSPDGLAHIGDIQELMNFVQRDGKRKPAAARAEWLDGRAEESSDDRNDDVKIPSLLRRLGSQALDAGQNLIYDSLLVSKFEGQHNIPVHTNFIVASNHASHLDTGLIKSALGEMGKDMIALGAADYFFDKKYKRIYFENFTNVVPIERSGSLRKSLRHAKYFLDNGYNALIYPEGTRTVTGEMADFKPIVGHLALTTQTGILPIYLQGTYDAFPKGASFLKSREVAARIGPFLSAEYLEELTDGMQKSEAYRLVAALTKRVIENIRDGVPQQLDKNKVRSCWDGEKLLRETELTDPSGRVLAHTGD